MKDSLNVCIKILQEYDITINLNFRICTIPTGIFYFPSGKKILCEISFIEFPIGNLCHFISIEEKFLNNLDFPTIIYKYSIITMTLFCLCTEPLSRDHLDFSLW